MADVTAGGTGTEGTPPELRADDDQAPQRRDRPQRRAAHERPHVARLEVRLPSSRQEPTARTHTFSTSRRGRQNGMTRRAAAPGLSTACRPPRSCPRGHHRRREEAHDPGRRGPGRTGRQRPGRCPPPPTLPAATAPPGTSPLRWSQSRRSIRTRRAESSTSSPTGRGAALGQFDEWHPLTRSSASTSTGSAPAAHGASCSETAWRSGSSSVQPAARSLPRTPGACRPAVAALASVRASRDMPTQEVTMKYVFLPVKDG